MKERPIIFSVTTGQPSQRGKRMKAADGLTWKQRNREAVNARRVLAGGWDDAWEELARRRR
jgi:hypothetical protein